uniref:Uncharacterized protein n=1 Tax=Panagrolaimus sp. PS1159 TaxID=55785 RepID=A0AC35GKI7_9BILA
MNVGIVDHNNVEEISYRIILEGINPEYDEKRQETIKIDDQKNEKLFCNEKIWYRSLFDTSEDDQMPLIFKVSIKYRFKGEEFNPFQQSFAPQLPLHEQQLPQYLQHQQWDSELDENLLETSNLVTLAYLGIIYLIVANALKINFISSLFQIFCYLLSFAFTLNTSCRIC